MGERADEPASPPRLAYFVSFSGNSGVERVAVNLVNGLVEQGVAVDLLIARARSRFLTEISESVTLYRLGANNLTSLPGLVHYLRTHRPRVLMAAKDRAGRIALIARAIAGVSVPVVIQLHTNASAALRHKPAWIRWLRFTPMRLLYPRADRIVAVSHGVADDVTRITGIPPERIDVIPNPVIPRTVGTTEVAAPAHPWLAESQPLVVSLGRLTRQKDFATLIRAFAQIPRSSNARLLIFGEGAERRTLERLTADLQLTDRIALPGHTTTPHQVLTRADVFVMCSQWEGLSLVLIEALACGTPVVATDCPSGPREILDEGRYGRLVPVGDHKALARAVTETLTQPPNTDALVMAAKRYHSECSVTTYRRKLNLTH